MKRFMADLHLHTCLSPCGELEMTPTEVIKKAKSECLDIIGISDHNSGENAEAFMKAGEREGIVVIPGIEITSEEEVHILGFFRYLEDLRQIQNWVHRNLPGENDEEKFGMQVVVDEFDEPVELSEKLLIGATTLSVEKIVERIKSAGGLAIASHIDRESFSLVGQLGFVPPGLKLDALEVSPRSSIREWKNYPVVTFSDAHFLDDIGKSRTSFWIEKPCIGEFRKALLKIDGRRIEIP